MRPWCIGCVVLLDWLCHGVGAAFAGTCLTSGPGYQLVRDTVEWSMKIDSGQSCMVGLRFYNVVMDSAKLVSLPQSGGVTLQGLSFTYTAKPDFQGQDSFSIAVAGSIKRIYGSSTIHVTVSIGGASPTVHLPVQDQPAEKVEALKSVPTATPGQSIQVDGQKKTTRVNWFYRIGELTIVGCLSIALCFLVSVNCWILARKLGAGDAHWHRERGVWRSIAVLFLGLGINRQLHLDSVFTQAGRVLAYYQGWYGHRALVQLTFIAQVALTYVVVAIILVIWARHAAKSTRLALVCSMLVLGFVSIRAASYHYVDKFLDQSILGFRWNSVLELTGITLVLLASLWRQGALGVGSPAQIEKVKLRWAGRRLRRSQAESS